MYSLEMIRLHRDDKTWQVVIPSSLSEKEDEKVLEVLRKKKEAMEWTIFDLEKIGLLACRHHMEDDPEDI